MNSKISGLLYKVLKSRVMIHNLSGNLRPKKAEVARPK